MTLRSVWDGPEGEQRLDLVDVEAEVQLLASCSDESQCDEAAESLHALRISNCLATSSSSGAALDGAAIARELARTHAGAVLAVNQLVPLTVGGVALLLRVSAADTLDADSAADALSYHCFRGRLVPDTAVRFEGGVVGGLLEASAVRAACSPPCCVQIYLCPASSQPTLKLAGACERRAAAARDMVYVHTNDEETFPVKKRLLRPCIALTAAVRSAEPAVDASVDIDTLTFDRCLIFLETLAQGRELPNFGAHLLDALLAAGRELRCQSLVSFCECVGGRCRQPACACC